MARTAVQARLRFANHEPTSHAPRRRGGEAGASFLRGRAADGQEDHVAVGLLHRFRQGSARTIALLPPGMPGYPTVEPRRDAGPRAAIIARVVGADLGGCLAAGSRWAAVT